MLYVGRLSPEKEVQVLIESYANLKTIQPHKTKLVIVGDGPDFARLKSLPEAKGVIFTGSLRGQDLAAAYASADVFVFASQVETFGNVVLEAMASGLPVIAYDYACAHQYLTHGVNGWLSPLGQKNHFIQQIYQLPSVQQLREMGVQACHKVQQSGWQLPVQQLEQAFYQVVKEPSLDFT
jgi:glycosyltransferase involved in cell wall biosynthesis